MEGGVGLLVDAAVGVLVIVSAYLAMVRGFIREMFALASWIIAFFAALFFAPFVKPALVGLPVVGELLESCEVQALVAFIIVFGLALIVAGLVFFMFSGPTRNTTASVLDQGLGFMYGALRGLVLVAVIYVAYVKIVPQDQRQGPGAAVEGALTAGDPLPELDPDGPLGNLYSAKFVRPIAEFLWSRTPSEMPDFLRERAEELTGKCENQ